MTFRILVEGINPEPWTAPRISVWHGKAQVYKDERLRTYQAAMAELVEDALIAAGYQVPLYGPDRELAVRFHFWRQQDEVKTGGRKTRRNYADATNMLKATEDALQGVLYGNDRRNRLVTAELVAWSPDLDPAVLVEVRDFQVPAIWNVQREWVKDRGERFHDVVIMGEER